MTAPPVSEAQDVCASDPNFAVIFAFCERFGDSCGVTIPTFQELQEMLEKNTEVPDALVDLHIKLLRRLKKNVNADKWERSVLKFCQEYSIPEFWDLEHYGYKGISVKLKLKILKTLFEAQFDGNVKFKAEVNKLDSSTLHSQPLGCDRSGIAYWVQFDRACNLRVYKEDIDEDTWQIVAKDRSSLVNLINELSGEKDNTLDDIEDSNSIETGSDGEVELPSNLNQEKHSPTVINTAPIIENNQNECSTTESSNIELEKNEFDPKENSLDKPINLKRKLDEDTYNKSNIPIVGEEIEESVMIVKGEGSGQECDTGNPDETNTENETSKNEDIKKPKLWSIEAICSSSKEVREEISSVPTTGFFFGDDSVPCFTNVSNGEDSNIDNKKLDIDISNKNIEDWKKNKKTDESNKNKKTDEELNKNIKSDDVVSTSHSCKSLHLDEFSCKNASKQSVFNIKIHEEEVQITERKANEVFTKSKSNPNVYSSTSFDNYSKSQDAQINSITTVLVSNKDSQSQISNKPDTEFNRNEKKTNNELKVNNIHESAECKKVEVDQANEQSIDLNNSDIHMDKQLEKQEKLSVKLEENTKGNNDQQLEENIKKEKYQQSTTKIVCEPIKTNKNTIDNNILINKQSTNKINESDKGKIVDIICEKVILSESFANTVGQYADINEQQSIDVLEENECILDKSLPNVADKSSVIDNQTLVNKFTTIDNKELVKNKVDDNEPEKQISEHIQTTDNTNATYSNNDLNQHTVKDNSIINPIASSSKAYDQTVTDNVDQCPQTSKNIAGNQNNNKSKKTSHNISNIIDTDLVVSDINLATKQSINYVDNENKQRENSKIKKEKTYFQEKEQSAENLDCPIVSTNKHDFNKTLHQLDTVKEMSKCLHSEFSNVDIEIDKTGSVKSELEINIEELNSNNKNLLKDLTVVKEVSKLTKKEKNISVLIPSVPKNQKEMIDEVTKSDKDYELSTVSMVQCKKDEIKQDNLYVNHAEIKPKNNDKNEKHNLINVLKETDTRYEEKLNVEQLKRVPCNKDNIVHGLSVQESTLKVEALIDNDEVNAVINLDNDKNVINKSNKMSKILENKEKETNSDKDIINQSIKIEVTNKGMDKEDMVISSEEQIATSPVDENINKSTDETIQEISKESSKEEFHDTVIIDQTFEEDNINSEEEEVTEETPKKKGRPGRKKGKRGRAKKITTVKQESISNSEEKVKRPYKPRQKKVVTILEEVTIIPEPASDDNVRRSRRIAEIKIKEQFIPTTQYDDIDIPLKSPKKKDKSGKKGSTPSKKLDNAEESDDEDEEDPISKKFKKKKRKGKSDSLKKINMVNPWNVDSESSSSENNVGLFEDYDHEEEEEIPRPGIEPNISDHEFSPESDINDEDEEYLPEKRARTAHKKDEGEKLKDDMCQKCNKSDQPEWILLCDTCNLGWHASCLRPPLMVIPDGDWYCPPCRHKSLLNALKDTLKRYDGESKKRENEELRRKRLAYVGISLQNVISSKTEEVKSEKKPVVHESSEDDEEESESEDYDSEPLYTLRARRQANVSYRFNDYDDMINEAILEETGVDESATKKSPDVKTDKNDNDENSDSDNDENDREDSPIAPALLHLRGRKKSKKLTNLDISSDDGSDEDFKGPSDGDDDDEDDLSEYSDDSVKRKPQPTRRSVRNRKNVVDPDFINDDSSDSDQRSKKKKRTRPWSDSSNSEDEDLTWGKKKKKRTNTYSSSSFSSKLTKGSKRKRNENDDARKLKSKIKFGMNSDSESDGQPKRRTRGRQITYAESDVSEEEIQTKKRKIAIDEEDEYVLNDEELEVENEDHTLEVDEDDTVASNEEKGEEDDYDEEEAVDEEEEDEEEDVDRKQASILGGVTKQIAMETPLLAAVIKSTNREPISSSSNPVALDIKHEIHSDVHPRLLPSAAVRPEKALSSLIVDPEATAGSPDKRKRPQHQLKKCSSPITLVDYGGSACYPYAPDATKVAVSVVQPSPGHVSYSKPPAVVSTTGVFKTMVPQTAGDVSFPLMPAPYRTSNKMTAGSSPTPSAYLSPPPQVQRVYQAPTPTPPPTPQPSSTNYSPYPIDYTAAETTLPPPPPAIPFRNIVVAPPSLDHSLQPITIPQQQQQSSAGSGGGDSEFGGLVSYFSSQQEDDFDT